MNRFHNKYHRHNHHTLPTAGEPDSSHDPIASPEDPFQGDFHINGQLSATSAIVSNLSVLETANFYGPVNILSVISYTFDHIKVTPLVNTQDYYFKIDSQYNNYPFFEILYKNNPLFCISPAGLVGIGTDSPLTMLDVKGDASVFNLSALDLAADDCKVKNITSEFTSVLGYLKVNYTENFETIIQTIKGDKNLYFKCGNTTNLLLLNNNTNIFDGKVGIKAEPTEHLTIKGQQSFKNSGYIVLDNSYENTLRIINNKEKPDGEQNYFCFTENGKFVVSNMNFDSKYKSFPVSNSYWNNITDHKISVFSDTTDNCLSLTYISNISNSNGPTMRFFRANGNITGTLPVKPDDNLGSICAYGYSEPNIFNKDGNAGIRFYADNIYSNSMSQGGYITLHTTSADDATAAAKDRLIIDSNGNVGVYNFSSLKVKPSSKLTVINVEDETSHPTVSFDSGTMCATSINIKGGSGIDSIINLQLSQLQTNSESSQSINFTHTPANLVANKIISTYRPVINGVNYLGSSLSLCTTNDCDVVPAYPRLTITSTGDVGIGSEAPVSRLHVHNDDGTLLKSSPGSTEDVATFSAAQDTVNICLSAVTVQTRICQSDSPTNGNGTIILTTGNSVIFQTKSASANTTQPRLTFNGSDVKVFDGTITSTLVGTPSDIKIKDNIQPITDSLIKLNKISGVNFNWNEKVQNDFKGRDVGVIAQEIEQILPEAVFDSGDGYKKVWYHKLIPLLIESIKELNAEINILKNNK